MNIFIQINMSYFCNQKTISQNQLYLMAIKLSKAGGVFPEEIMSYVLDV